ncbi:putative lipid II flippase FtsW [Tepidiphilus margaritifer]|uniref:putative lipid II flippase FtsW n=1 Tax=Tepidiphilus margaritifer TaxID=203471 RepID=UPI0003FC866D|nr:putative lipid II flippase FtsW [Tepidiphilus margaritifer]
MVTALIRRWFGRGPDRFTEAAVRHAGQVPPARFGEFDLALFWAVTALTLFGLVMVYSASIAFADESRATGGSASYFLVRQLVFVLLGAAVAWGAFRVPMRVWQSLTPWLFLLGVAMLVLVLVPGVGKVVNGSRRWIPLGPINLQPSEFMKLFVAFYAADYTVRKLRFMASFWRGFLPLAFVVVLVGVLLLLQPDFGAFAVISAIAFGVLFLGGLRLRIFFALMVLAGFAFAGLILSSEYRRQRLFAFLDPWADPLGKGYQLTHALIAFGRGEWFGVGLGGSVEKLFYLPEAHTDFLLAVVGEELGWVGVCAVVALFAVVIWRTFTIGRGLVCVEQYFSGLAVFGIGLWIGVQALINMGVNVGLLPTKGLTLPFMSYGGSGIIANLAAMAVVLRADWELRCLRRGVRV